MNSILTYKLEEAQNMSGVDQSFIQQFITEEWIIPADPGKLFLDDEDIERIKLIWELKEDLGVNDDAVPIILHLIDQLNHLHLVIKKS